MKNTLLIFALRTIIVLIYVVLLAPWALLYFLGSNIFAVLGVAFLLLGFVLLPKARRDWNMSL